MTKPDPTPRLTATERRAAKIAALQARQATDLALAQARDIIDDVRAKLRAGQLSGDFMPALDAVDSLRAVVGKLAGVEAKS